MPTKFISTIRPVGQNAAFNSLAAWEALLQADITASNSKVFLGWGNGNFALTDVALYRNDVDVGVSGGAISTISEGCCLLYSLTNPSYSFQSGDVWKGSQSRTFTIYTTGDSPIVCAQIDGNWNGVSDSEVTLDGWTTGPDNYIEIYTTGDTSRHKGYWDTGKYILYGDSTNALVVNEDYVNIDGLQISVKNPTANWQDCISSNGDGLINFKSLIIAGHDSNYYQNLVKIGSTGVGTQNFHNCIGWNRITTDSTYAFYHVSNNAVNFINCTCFSGKAHYYRDGSASGGASAYNCISEDCAAGIYAFLNIPSGTNNVSDNTVLFVDQNNGDFRLSPYDTSAILKGTGLSNLFTNDIGGINRGTGLVWDLGAFHAPVYIKTVAPSGQSGSYNSLNALEAGEQRDLTLVNKTLMCVISGTWNTSDVIPLFLDWGTSRNNRVSILTTGAARHTGVWKEDGYHISVVNQSAFVSHIGNIDIDGIQTRVMTNESGDGGNKYSIYFGNAEAAEQNSKLRICNNIVRCNYGGVGGGVYGIYFNNVTVHPEVYDNFLIDEAWNSSYGLFTLGITSGTIFNNTFAGWYRPIEMQITCSGIKLFNNLFAKSYWPWTLSPIETMEADYNASDIPLYDGRNGAAHERNSVNFRFIDTGNYDYRLSPYDTGALLYGTGLSQYFTTDIAGTNRGTGTIWDIGAHHATSYIRTIKPDGQTGNYVSLNAWEAGENRDLTLVNKTAIAEIGGTWTGAETNTIDIDGWTTNPSNYIDVHTVYPARHSGYWDIGKYCLYPSGDGLNILVLREAYTRVSGLQIGNAKTDGYATTLAAACTEVSGERWIVNNILRGSGVRYGFLDDEANTNISGKVWYFINNVFDTITGNFDGMDCVLEQAIYYIYNNTFYSKGNRYGLFLDSANVVCNAENNLSVGHNIADFGSFSRTTISNNNASSDSSADDGGGNNNRILQNFAFVNAQNGDLRLSPFDTGALLKGISKTNVFKNDIVGTYRGTGDWDIGASHSTSWYRYLSPEGGGDYNGLYSLEAGEQRDLQAHNKSLIVEITGNWSGLVHGWPGYVNEIYIGGWNSDSGHDIKLNVVGTARHTGIWTQNAFTHYDSPINVQENVSLDGWQYTPKYDYYWGLFLGFMGSGITVNVRNSICYSPSPYTSDATLQKIFGYGWAGNGDGTLNVENCVFDNISGALPIPIVSIAPQYWMKNIIFRNCTFNKCNRFVEYWQAGNIVQNCLFTNCASGGLNGYGIYGQYCSTDSSSGNNVPWFLELSNNRYDQNILFKDVDNHDFSLSPYDTGALLQGTGLSSLFTTDIRGVNRGTQNWDIGAYHTTEYIRTIKPEGQTGHYNSLGSFEAAENKDLVASNKTVIAEAAGNWSGIKDKSDVGGYWARRNFDGWTTSTDNRIKIRTDAANRHSGIWDDTKYSLWASGDYVLGTNENFFEVSGLQIAAYSKNAGQSNNTALYFVSEQIGTGRYVITDNIIRGINQVVGELPGNGVEMFFQPAVGPIKTYYYNNLIYGFQQGYGIYNGVGWETEIYNCTIDSCAAGVSTDHWRSYGVWLKNTLFTNCAAIVGNAGLFNSDSCNNVANTSGTIVGTNSYTEVPIMYVNSGAGDFRLSPYDTGAMFKGVALTGSLTKDIRGINRGTTTWDVGAYHATSYIKTIKPAGQSGDYASLSAWEAGEQRDLTLVNKEAKAEIAGDWSGVGNDAVQLDGFTTTSGNYVKIYVTGNARHSGVWDDSKYKISGLNNFVIQSYLGYLECDGLQMSLVVDPQSSETFVRTFATRPDVGLTKLTNTIMRAENSHPTASTVGFDAIYGQPTVLQNCLAYGANGTLISDGFVSYNPPDTFKVYNCTVANGGRGFWSWNNNGMTAINCLANCSQGFFGTFHSNSSNNCSAVGDAPGSNPISGAAQFVNAPQYDFRLKSTDTVAKGQGLDLSAYFTNDIVGNTRTGTWDIGASMAYEVGANIIAYSGTYLITPKSDVNAGEWTVAPLYEKVNEEIPDTGDFISSPYSPSNDACDLLLANSGTPSGSRNHTVKYQFRKENNDSKNLNLIVWLYQGATGIIASGVHNNISNEWVQGNIVLTSGQRNMITDYTDLRIKLEADET